MKKKKGDLTGQTVMVRPDYESDPARRKGETGKVISFFPERKIITVQFKDTHTAAYLPDCLLLPASGKMILRALVHGLVEYGDDCRRCLKIYRLAVSGKHKRALKMAMYNHTTRFYCTVPCSGRIKLKG